MQNNNFLQQGTIAVSHLSHPILISNSAELIQNQENVFDEKIEKKETANKYIKGNGGWMKYRGGYEGL